MNLNFKPGDVILFEAENENNFLEMCIMKLTDSKITHSAMIYKNNAIVEMTGSGISLTPFHVSDKGIRIHALRFTPERDSLPLLKAADVYLKNKINYDYADLILLAGLLIFKKLTLDTKLSEVILTILQIACQILDEIYQDLENDGKNASMMCSQLVYQCYYDCGPDYKIIIRNGLLQQPANHSQRIYDCIAHIPNGIDRSQEQLYSNVNLNDVDVNSLAEELYETLSKEVHAVSTIQLIDAKCHPVLNKASEFIEKIEKLLKAMEIDMPLPALFVTPADLFSNAENLICYGTAFIEIDE